jgi:outer membrane receptor protein involved in Fe transport
VTVSDDRGEYRFADLPAGEYLLEAESAGLAPAALGRISVGHGEPARIDLRLALPRTSARIVVSAAGTPQTAEQTSKAFDVVDAPQIDRRAEYSILDSLRLTPGLRVQQMGGPGSLGRIQSRGLRAFDTSLLIDGFRLRDSSAPQGDATASICWWSPPTGWKYCADPDPRCTARMRPAGLST